MVSVTIAGMPVTPLYAGPQNAIPGLDQVNVQIPSDLRGAGISLVVLTVEGQPANLVYIVIQ